MTSLELVVIQGVVLVVLAPVCASIGTTLVTLVTQKTWVMPWAAYRRENSVVAAVAFGAAMLFALLLPLQGFGGIAGTDGTIFTLIALLAIVGGAAALLEVKSILPMALCALGASLLALGVATSSVNSSDVLMATSQAVSSSTVLAVIAFALVLITLRLDAGHERVRDVRMLLSAAFGGLLVNVVAMMTVGNILTTLNPALDVLIFAGKILGAALIIELLAFGVRRYGFVTPVRIVKFATFLAILSIITTLWHLNPSL